MDNNQLKDLMLFAEKALSALDELKPNDMPEATAKEIEEAKKEAREKLSQAKKELFKFKDLKI